MRHGTTIRVTSRGLLISPARLKTIGLYDRSVAWAVWLPPFSGRASRRADLLVTAINPEAWPYTFRLTLRLKNESGTMAKAAAALHRLGVNILSARSSVSGHHHATWNLIGEALPLRTHFETVGWQFRKGLDELRRDEIAALIAEKLLRFLDKMLKQIAEDHKEELADEAYLHQRFLQGQLLSLPPDALESAWNDDARWQRIGDQRSRAVACAVLPVLSFLWRKGATNLSTLRRDLIPLEFEYDRDAGLLRTERARFRADLEQVGAERPGVAVASFDTDEHFLRLRFFTRQERERLRLLSLDYHHRFGTKRSTSGLIETIAGCLADRKLNLVQVSNSIRAQDEKEEAGSMRFIAELPDSCDELELARLERVIERDLRESFGSMEPERVEFSPITAGGRVFVSRHHDLARLAPIEAIGHFARRSGLELVETRVVADGVTERAVREIRSCQGLVQVYGHREEGGEDQIHWLIGEYAIAAALELPALRIVDLHVKSENDWKNFLRWDQDRPLVTYDSSLKKERIFASLAEQLERFFREILFRSTLPGGGG